MGLLDNYTVHLSLIINSETKASISGWEWFLGIEMPIVEFATHNLNDLFFGETRPSKTGKTVRPKTYRAKLKKKRHHRHRRHHPSSWKEGDERPKQDKSSFLVQKLVEKLLDDSFGANTSTVASTTVDAERTTDVFLIPYDRWQRLMQGKSKSIAQPELSATVILPGTHQNCAGKVS